MLNSIPNIPQVLNMAGLQRVLRKLYSRDSRFSEYASGSQYTKNLNVSGILIC